MLDELLKDRTQWPRFVNRAIDSVADHPLSVAGRVSALRYGRASGQRTTPVSVAGPNHRRVLIAPVNYAGQGFAWSRALVESASDISAVNMAVDVPGGFSFPADLVVPVPVYQRGRTWQNAQLRAVSGFTHVLAEASEPLFGRLLGRDPTRENERLRQAGVSVANMGHGTDVRPPAAHAARTQWSPYRDRGMYTERLERVVAANLRRLEQSGTPIFVSTPDLLLDVPGARWCPVVIDSQRWSAARSHRSGPLRVIHAPSVGSIKGTHLIEPRLERLQSEGIISYRRISGVDWSEMPAVMGDADVVLDQFRLGSYGVAACEAMAAGKLVIGHVPEEVRAAVRRETGMSLPVVEATPDSIEDVLASISEDRSALEQARVNGEAFVEAVHGGGFSASVLRNHWIDPAEVT